MEQSHPREVLIKLQHQAGWEILFLGKALTILHSKQELLTALCLPSGAGDVHQPLHRNPVGWQQRVT